MKPEFDNIFSYGKGRFTRCSHNIMRGGYLMMMFGYKGRGEGSRILEKVIT